MSQAVFTLGLGCDRGTSVATLDQAVTQALAQLNLPRPAVIGLASIDLKADEPCMHALAQRLNCPIRFYSAQQLAAVPVPNPSKVVLRHTGTPSVSEAAALLAAGARGQPAPLSALRVEKHKHLGADGKNATVSVAWVPPVPTD
jgi:cobalt-precorrin 5A hydrolase